MGNTQNTHVPIYLRFFGKNKKTDTAATAQQPTQTKPPKPKPKPKGTPVAKYELSDGKVKFIALRGAFKKRWVTIQEMPIQEITNVEGLGNQISVTWGGVVYSFVLKSKTESFSGLQTQIMGLLSEQQQTTEKTEKLNVLKADLSAAINASLGTIDVSFDVLMALHTKRVDWSVLEGHAQKLGSGLSFNGKTLAPLNVDFTKVSAGIKAQVPKDVSGEALNVLKTIYSYFNSLTASDGIEDNTKTLNNAKTAMLAYYTLNDVMFAKVTGQKDDEKELLALEKALVSLADESNIKVNVDELKATLDKLSLPEGDVAVADVRTVLRQQLGGFEGNQN